MEIELKQLRAENEQIKLRLEAVKTFFNHGVLFEQRNHLVPIIGLSRMLMEEGHGAFDGTHINPIGSIERSSRIIRDIQQQTEDFIQAAVNQAFEAKVFQVETLLDQIYSLSYCRLEAFIDRKLATQKSYLPNKGIRGELIGFDLCLKRIAFELNHISESDPVELFLTLLDQKCIIEISTPYPSSEEMIENNSWAKRYLSGYVDPVSKIIFGLYDGALRSEKRENRIVSILELPLIEMEAPNEK